MNQLETTSLEDLHHVKETETFTKTQDGEGRSVINEYTFIKLLGEGAYGKVKLAIQMESLKKYAVKVIKKDLLKRRREMIRDERGRVKYKDAFEDVLREIAIMKKLNHPNLVKLNEVINNPDAAKMYMVMDFAEKGQIIEFDDEERTFFSLSDKASIEEEELRSIFAQIIKGIHYLHVNGIVHRDLKPQNILQAEDGTIKIADFGLANIFGDSDKLTKVEGTHHFMSPESLLSDQNGYSGKIADIWALGVSFFAYTFYKPPFDGEDLVELFDNIKTQELAFPEERQISSELKDLLSQLLDKDPVKRITLEQLENHAWFQASKNKDLVSNLQAKPEEITVTTEEIQNAITSFEKVVFMKKVCKRMITNFRRISALSQNSKHATLIKEVLDNATSSAELSSNGTLVLQPGQKQSSIAEGVFEGGLDKYPQSADTLIKDSEPLQLPESLDREVSDNKPSDVETLTEQVQALVLGQNQSSTDSENQIEQPIDSEPLDVNSLLKKALLLQPGQNQSSTAEYSNGISIDKDSSNAEGLVKETQLIENTQNQNLIASDCDYME